MTDFHSSESGIATPKAASHYIIDAPPSPSLAETSSAPHSASRRLLLGAGIFAATLMPRSRALAQNGGNSTGGNPAPATWKNQELRLVRRVTMGLDIEAALSALETGHTKYLETLLNDAAIDDSDVENYVASHYPTLAMSPAQLHTADSNLPQTQLVEATLFRSIYSKRQLRQRMTEFWSDHFNIDIHKVGTLKVTDDRDVIRPHALGKFSDLLHASAKSPAMLDYLDNSHSRKEHPNQNYARELMELHTLSVNGGYTQTDIQEVARCFTGWTRNFDTNSADYGRFVYNSKIHDDGAKLVLGHKMAAGGGIKDGEAVLDILAAHPATAKFIATKMLHWLLREDPSPELIAQIAKVYMDTKGDIKAMIRAILAPALLKSAPAKYKRPYHLVVSAIRAANPTISSFDGVRGQLNTMGHAPFSWAAPNGYPDALGYWAGLILPRWNFGLLFAENRVSGLTVDVKPLLDAKTPAAIVALLNMALFTEEITPGLQAELTAYLTQTPLLEARIRDAGGLALASPEFQLY